MLPGPAVPGCCLVSFHFLCYILCSRSTLFSALVRWVSGCGASSATMIGIQPSALCFRKPIHSRTHAPFLALPCLPLTQSYQRRPSRVLLTARRAPSKSVVTAFVCFLFSRSTSGEYRLVASADCKISSTCKGGRASMTYEGLQGVPCPRRPGLS